MVVAAQFLPKRKRRLPQKEGAVPPYSAGKAGYA
jgi:hypothetical protein